MPHSTRLRSRSHARLALTALGVAITLTAVSCGDSSEASDDQVASLGTLAATTEETVSASSTEDTQEALLAYAACMRENGIDMADPTFDADGNTTAGGLFGPDSGIDPQAEGFQAAQEACGSLIEGITLGGGGQGGGLDVDAVQTSLNDFTECLRDEGLSVDDVDFGGGQGPGGGGGGFGGAPTDGSLPEGVTPPDGSVPAGGFAGGAPPDGAGGPGGEGFDPTTRIIEQLGLDADDPTVNAAIDACQSILDGAFQPADSTDSTTG